MAAPMTYSFLNTQCTLAGPGGVISLGAGVGVDEEGITVEPSEDMDEMTIGADGQPMHSLIANKSGVVTIRLLKTSPTNQQLSALQAFQRLSGLTHGQNVIKIDNTLSGDNIVCQLVAFARVPNITYSKNPKMNEWKFNAGIIDQVLGAGVAQ